MPMVPYTWGMTDSTDVPRAGHFYIKWAFTPLDTANYSIKIDSIPVVVNKRGVIVFHTALNKAYDGNMIAQIRVDSISGIINKDKLSATCSSGLFDTKNVGLGKTVSQGADVLAGDTADYYPLPPGVFPPGATGLTANITPDSLTITALDTFKVAGEIDPAFNLKDSGFVTGEDLSLLTGLVVIRDPGEIAGSYSINPSGAIDPNYIIKYVAGTFTIKAGTAIIDNGPNSIAVVRKGILVGPNPVRLSSGAVQILVTTDSPSSIKMSIYDALGNKIDEQNGLTQSSGVPHHFTWDLKNQTGRVVEAGSYLAVALVKDRDSGIVKVMKALIGVNK